MRTTAVMSLEDKIVLALRKFYEEDAVRRHAGSKLVETQKIALNMLSVTSSDWVLEVGCGGGALLSELERKRALTVGLDLSGNQIIQAKKICKDTLFIVADAQNLPFRDQCFSKCFAIEVLEHIPDPNRIIKEFYRVLKREGELLIVVPNDRNWFVHRIVQAEIGAAFYDFGHLHSFSSISELKPFLKGFNIVEIRENRKPTFFLLGLFSWVFQGAKNSQSLGEVQKSKPILLYSRYFSPLLILHLIIELRKV